MAALDFVAARFLTWRYALALGVIALLTLAAQVVVQVALSRQMHDAAVVNLAGRQRMLSQRLIKAALALRTAEPADRSRWQEERATALGEWLAAHDRLRHADDLPGAGRQNSTEVARILAAIDPVVLRMAGDARLVEADAQAVHRLLADEVVFLPQMETVVGLYHAEAAERVAWTRRLELGLCVLLLAVLIAEALLVFRPAVQRLRLAISDRERLREREALDREQAVAAQTARDIGQDLHDGLGQVLTGLSFQARALELDSLGAARDQARVLHTGITASIAQVRALARRLAPVDVQVVGLEGALQELAEATARAAGITCTLEWEPGLTLPSMMGEDLYRIAQEALTNTLRHGHARHATLRLSHSDGRIVFTISDDGAAPTIPQREGVGTRAMRARATRLGATCTIGPRPEGGWQVSVALSPTLKNTNE